MGNMVEFEDQIVSFDEWCIQCDLRGVNKFFGAVKDYSAPHTYPHVKAFLSLLPCVNVDTSDNSSITYYLFSLNFIKNLRARPTNYFRVASHELPFANEIEIEYRPMRVNSNGDKIPWGEWHSLFGYISWEYSTFQ